MATIAIPKTVTSKKGNLSIVSENLKARHVLKKHRRHLGRRLSTSIESSAPSEGSFSAITVDDLASSVLNFGSKGNESVCLDIQQMTTSSVQEPKIVRPGFSARRYLASWTKTLDEDTVNTWLSLGKLSEKTIFQTNAFLPHLRKRANDNLSEYPAPYRIVKQMLIAPGPLNEYSFIWSKKEVSDDGLSRGDIQVFSEDKAELVKYSDLDKDTQKGILSKLLVKSALSYGLTKAQESQTAEPGESVTDASSGGGQFDMVHAVRSLLDRDTNALREEDDRSGGAGGAGSTGEDFSPDDERVFERIRQKRLRDSKLRRQKLLQQRARRSGASGSGHFAMQGEHVGPDFEPPEWERPARPTDRTGGFLPPLVEDQLPMATRSLRTGDHEEGVPGRRPKLPRLAVSLDATGSNDSEEEDGEGDTTRREAADRVMELPFEGPARSGPVLFGSMPRARGVWGNFSQRGRPQPSPLQQQQQQQKQQQQEQQQKADSGRGVQLKTADLFLGAEPESRISTAEDDASTDSKDLASVRLKTRKARQDAKNLRVRSPVKREVNLKGGDFDATKFLVAHKAADGLLSAGPSPAATPPSPLTLQSDEDEAEAAGLAEEEEQGLQLGGRGLIAPAHGGPGGERVDVAAMSQDQLMSVLTQHAEEVAESVLKNQTAGQDIAEDVQKAIADLMTQRAIGIPAQPRRHAGGGQAGNAAAMRRSRQARKAAAAAATAAAAAEKAEFQDGVGGVGGQVSEEKTSEAAASAVAGDERDFGSLTEEEADEVYNEEAEAEEEERTQEEEERAQEEEAAFKDAIKTALISAITKSAGGADASDSANEDIELPDDILEMLVAPGSGGLQPADLVVVIDPLTGRRVISTRERLVQQAMEEAQADPEAALAQMQATASRGQLPPLSASPSASSQQQTQTTTGEEKTAKQAKPKEAFRVPRVVHKDSIQSVFTGDVSREASNVEELTLPRIPSNLLKSAAASAAVEPGKKPAGKTKKLKVSKKKPPKTLPSAAATETQKSSEDKKTVKKKGAGKKAATAAGRKDSIAPGAEGAIEDEEGEAVQRPEEEMSFVRVDEYFSDEEGANRDPMTMMAVDADASAAGASSSVFPPGEVGDEIDDAEFERQLQEQMRRMNVKEQRELRRRAEAERRRRETDRRRKEAAEKRRRDQEAAERQSQMEQEMEAERLRKEEEVRERRRLEREARERAEEEAEAAERRERLAKDREQRERENFMRKLQEARQKKEEEEQMRRIEEMRREEEMERLRQEEEARLAQMEENERLEYLRRKAEEEEQRRREEEAERLRQEAEAKKALEEARRLAEELAAVRAAELARRRFQRSLRVEKAGHERYLSVTPAFVFSYFDLLKWVGVDLSNAVKASTAAKA